MHSFLVGRTFFISSRMKTPLKFFIFSLAHLSIISKLLRGSKFLNCFINCLKFINSRAGLKKDRSLVGLKKDLRHKALNIILSQLFSDKRTLPSLTYFDP